MPNEKTMRSLVFWVSALGGICGAVYTNLMSADTTDGWFLLVCAFAGMIAAKFDSVVELTIGPLKARLERRIAEADVALFELRQVARTIAGPIVSIASRMNRLGTAFSMEERTDLEERLSGSLDRIGIPTAEIRELFSEHRQYMLLDFTWPIKKIIDETYNKKAAEVHEAIKSYTMEQGGSINAGDPQHALLHERLRAVTSEGDHFDSLHRANDISSYCDAITRSVERSSILSTEEKKEAQAAFEPFVNDFRHYLRTGEVMDYDRYADS